MSILMDALKRQQQHPVATPAAGSGSPFWLGLLVGVLGLSSALAVGYWLGAQQQTVMPVAEKSVAEASQQHILAALIAEPVVAAVPSVTAPATVPEPAETTLVSTKAKQQATAAVAKAEAEEAQRIISAERPARASMPSLSDIDELDVTSELQQRFSQAMDATSQHEVSRQNVRMHNAPAVDISGLDEVTQRQLPSLRFEAHVYASTPAQRWVKVNGRTLQQGQWLGTDVQIVEILPNYVLMRFRQQEFSVAALSEWSY